MKNTLFICLLLLATLANAQTFTRMADFAGGTRQKMVSASVGTKIYCGLGIDSAGVMQKDFWQYETTTNTWTHKNDLPFAARRNVSACVIAGNLYVGLGWDGTSSLNDWWLYNAATDTWVQKASLPAAGRYWPGTFEWNGEGYLVCGGSGQGSFTEYNEVWKYTPATDTWTAQPNFSGTARNGGFCQSLGSSAYYGLGAAASAGTWLSSVYKYNLSTQTWSSIAPIPSSANIPVADGYAFWSAAVGRKLVVMNIDLDAPTLADHNNIYTYDTASHSWTMYPAANTASFRTWGLCGQVGNMAYVGQGAEDNSGTWYRDMWEVNLTALVTAVEEAHPYLEQISVFGRSSTIQTNIPQAVFDEYGELTLEIFSTEGKAVGAYKLQSNLLIDASALPASEYVYQLKAAKAPLKSGMILLL